MQERRVTLVMCWIGATALYIKLSHSLSNLKEREHPKPRALFNETLKQEVDRISLQSAKMKLAALASISCLLSLTTAYTGDMTHYDPGSPIQHPHPCLHLSTLTEHLSTKLRSRLLRLHLPRLRRRRRPLHSDDEQPRQPQQQSCLRHPDQHLQSKHWQHDSGYHRRHLCSLCVRGYRCQPERVRDCGSEWQR